MKKTPYKLAYEKLLEEIKARKKAMTNKSFKGFNVFVHHEDDSYFIFEDALLWEASIEIEGNFYGFKVVFPRHLEPFIFYPADLKTCYQYGDAVENTWEKTKVYRPKIIRKPAKDYLKKNKITLTCKDFDLHAILVKVGWDAIMCLTSANLEVKNGMIYIFTEHQGHFVFKRKDVKYLTWSAK